MHPDLPVVFFEWTWDQVSGWCQECRELSPADADAGTAAVAHLRTIFGEDFSQLPRRLFANLLNQAGWIYRWLDWLSRSLRSLESCPGHGQLIARLVHPDRFEEAMSVLETAERMHSAGLSVSFDVPVRIGTGDKVPDLHVVDPETGISFWCEVSVMYRSSDDRKASERFDRFTDLILTAAPDLAYAGCLIRVISDARTEELLRDIDAAITEARSGGLLVQVVVPHIIDFAVAPSGSVELEAWCRARGLHPGSFGAEMPETNQLRRLQMKIEKEEIQVPSGAPNVVVIPGQDLFSGMDDPVRRLHDIEEVVLDHPKIALLVACTDVIAHEPPQALLSAAGMFVISSRGDVARRLLVVENRRCAAVAPKVLVDKLRCAFTL